MDLDGDSYDLLARALRTRIERGLYSPVTESAWRVVRDAAQQGLPWRLSMEREEAESYAIGWRRRLMSPARTPTGGQTLKIFSMRRYAASGLSAQLPQQG